MSRLKSRLGRGLHDLYAALPVSWSTRLKLKSFLFRHLAPVFRHTNSYRRWLAFQAPLELLPLTPAAEATPVSASSVARNHVATDATDVAKRYVDELIASSVSGRSSAYLPLPDDLQPPAACRAKAIAFYLPQFHPIAENDAWWGRGFTEWTNVSRAVPQFVGHYQPRLPGELGFYDLRLVDVMRRQTELARLFGVHGFCFHYYWFSGRRLLERPLDQFLASDIDFPFCLCWANENWTRRWDGAEQDVLLGQTYNDDNDEAFIRDLVPYLLDRRYIRVDGKPLVVIYRPSLLPDCGRTLDHWRRYCREHGVGEIMLVMVQFDVDDPSTYGFDAAVEFPPHKVARGMSCINDTLEIVNPNYAGYVVDYDAVVDRAARQPDPDYSLIRGVFPSWDNEARKPGRGYTFAHASPDSYRRWLAEAVAFARRRPVGGDTLVFVNAWNEWAEGAYLEPDRRMGYAYLQATRDVLTSFGEDRSAMPSKVAVITHDAHPHGAQYLALNILRELAALGIDVESATLGEGELVDSFREIAALHTLDATGLEGLVARLIARGVTHVIANTSVSGYLAEQLRARGLEVVVLVHELPGVIRQFGLEGHLRAIERSGVPVVFAAAAVRDGVTHLQPIAPERCVIRPQGLYKRNAFAPHRIDEARAALRRNLGIPSEAFVVLGVGYADLRKGIDLFVDAGARLMDRRPDVHFVWVGHPDLAIEKSITDRIQRTGHAGRFHRVGRQSDTDLFYAGADVFALTSREDPYPTVVMEAFDASLPVVAFRDSGGFAELLETVEGRLVAREDAHAFADACAELADDGEERRRMGAVGREYVERNRAFRPYVLDLLALLKLPYPRISAVVPNYNYARYLPERVATIRQQTLQPMELIVLDDASSDDSLAVLESIAHLGRLPLRVVANSRNSGSVFRQWYEAVSRAEGDYVWIAEADDLADPEFLEVAAKAFADPSVVMSYTQSRQIDADGTELAQDYLDYVDEFGAQRWREPFVASLAEELRHGLAVKNTIPNVSGVLFHRRTLLDVLRRHVDEACTFRVAGDWLVYLAMLEKGRIAFSPQACNRHRRHSASVTLGGDNAPHLQEVMRVQQWARERYPDARAMRAASDGYARRLHTHFGLDRDGLSLDDDPRFARFLEPREGEALTASPRSAAQR